VRKNDRNFSVGDWLVLREYDPKTKKYTGNTAVREISHITRGGTFGLPKKLCVLSLQLPG
jgi:hypothetical protein